MGRRAGLALALLALALGAAGCGGGGVAKDATLSVYLAAPLRGTAAKRGRDACAGARAELARAGGRAGEVRLRVVCLDDSGAGGSRLAAIGADARRAIEDSSTVAYLTVADPLATRFSRTIVETAGIAPISKPSGRVAMAAVVKAIDAAGDTSQLREAVREAVEEEEGAGA